MARNAEKAMTTLARWRQSQLGGGEDGDKKRRPYLASECDTLKEAEKWRLEIIREVSKKVSQIQNAGLGEFRIRDLNDQINKLLREKRHWEYRCAELGGINYRKRFGPRFEFQGRETVGTKGYRYFGAAKDLPGVRELFATEPPPLNRKTRAELMKDIDADYYGYRDEDDGVIVPLEREAQVKALQATLQETIGLDQNRIEEEIRRVFEAEEVEEEELNAEDDSQRLRVDDLECVGPKSFISYVPYVPTLEEVRQAILKKKKEELLRKYIRTSKDGEEKEKDEEEDDD